MTVLQFLAFLIAGIIVGLVLGARWQRRRAERRRRESGLTFSKVLELIVTASESAIVVVDRFQDVILHNPRSEQLALVPDGRAVDPRIWAAAQRVFDRGGVVPIELTTAPETTGTPTVTITVRGTARMLTTEDPRFVLIFAEDESEMVRLEATRRDFVANVSHELKTPVGAISLLAEALLESADDADSVRHFGGRIELEALRMGNMVGELISLSRLQAEEPTAALDVVDIDSVVREAIERSATKAETAGMTVVADAPSGLEVFGDHSLLVTAVSNLVENAIAYSPSGSSVSISRGVRDDRLVLAVTDRGIGIAPEHRERVFERFFRVDTARSRATGGTGLGLAIVKHVAANHHGEVTLWSRLGTGSTFALRLPLYREEAQPNTPAPATRKGSGGGSGAAGSPMRAAMRGTRMGSITGSEDT
ncbi:sensor histidine kinase [Millisia brevis]|uniref:sensor histidine kinase n=1 Tax=Millisia brevis TaxID=264148 RepID=UPI0009FD7DBA|nr:ATP-binding protein [Millisia brevis]